MLTLGAVSLALLFLATAARTPPRHAFPKVERVSSEDAVRYWHAKAIHRLHLARRYERQRNTARDLLRKQQPSVTYAINLASIVYGVPAYQMHRVASCESGHNPYAQNGQYRGVFQEGPMFERGPFGRAGMSVWDPIANVMTAAYTVARGGWSQWSCKP